tara:strand:- start:2954 stop:3604 length:651 start_codon:yes stop_codon:yes gene_type:complete
MKAVLKISDCQLMHLRTTGKLTFKKQGNAFHYQLPDDYSILQHPLGEQLINWHKAKHKSEIDNTPQEIKSIYALGKLVEEILLPIERNFGQIKITYGFTSLPLKLFIQKASPERTAPEIDQHASYELNSAGNPINKKGGAACDVLVNTNSVEAVKFVTRNLSYDRIYFYGSHRPIHVSFSDDPVNHLQIMRENSKGHLYPSTKAYGPEAVSLAKSL